MRADANQQGLFIPCLLTASCMQCCHVITNLRCLLHAVHCAQAPAGSPADVWRKLPSSVLQFAMENLMRICNRDNGMKVTLGPCAVWLGQLQLTH